LAEEKTEDAQSQKVRCRREVYGHNGEIKRNVLCEEIDEREIRFV